MRYFFVGVGMHLLAPLINCAANFSYRTKNQEPKTKNFTIISFLQSTNTIEIHI